MRNETRLQVDLQDRAFADWVRGQFEELSSGPTGFRLIVELLETQQTVNLRRGAAQEANRIYSEANPDAGRMVTTDAQGNALPPEQQRGGTPTGTNITYNPDLAGNQVTVGGQAGNLQIIAQDPTASFGHELIHALHNARGENIAPPPLAAVGHALGRPNYLVQNPATGEAESPEETRTITGQTRFGAPPNPAGTAVNWPLEFNLSGGITEDQLRQERGLPARVSHHGGTRAYRVLVAAGETLDQMLARYSMANGQAMPAALQTALRQVFLEFNPYFRDHASVPAEVAQPVLDFPHGEYMALQMAFIVQQPAIAEQCRQLRVRGAQ